MSSWLSVTIQQSGREGAAKLKTKSPMQENKKTTLTQSLRHSDRREMSHSGSTFALRWDSDTHPVSG